jgi:hypothetical protein
MPLILTQHSSRDLNQYRDRENVIYHFPAQYIGVVNRSVVEAGDRRFLYQRPGASAAGGVPVYFGYGLLGDPYPDVGLPGHYFIDIFEPQPLLPVPLKGPEGRYYETSATEPLNLRGRSIRYIDPERYFFILAAGGALNKPFSALAGSGPVQDAGVFAPSAAPKDAFREMLVVPPGTGYVPHPDVVLDRYEAAALHERARADHQDTVKLIVERVRELGGTCLYNNNVDVLARIGERRVLIEVKSLSGPAVAVNRMRYGIGQLMDYRVRYKAELAEATPALAFGAQLDREVSWIANVLQENGIAFMARDGEGVVAGNDAARALPLFGAA